MALVSFAGPAYFLPLGRPLLRTVITPPVPVPEIVPSLPLLNRPNPLNNTLQKNWTPAPLIFSKNPKRGPPLGILGKNPKS